MSTIWSSVNWTAQPFEPSHPPQVSRGFRTMVSCLYYSIILDKFLRSGLPTTFRMDNIQYVPTSGTDTARKRDDGGILLDQFTAWTLLAEQPETGESPAKGERENPVGPTDAMRCSVVYIAEWGDIRVAIEGAAGASALISGILG